MGIIQLYNDNLRKLPNEYGDVSVMFAQTVYSDVTTTLVIFNKTRIASGHLNQYENKQ